MAVFLINGCKFKGCTLVFETLAELIQHIEEVHLEIDPKVLEKQENEPPTSVALSNIFKFYAGTKPRKSLLAIATKKNRHRTNSIMSTSASIRSLTPTSSEYDFDEDDLDSSLGTMDSEVESKASITAEELWKNQLVLSMVSHRSADSEKPYGCNVKGCKKRYKNINGVKYHAKHGHKREARMAKFSSKCFCGKSFQSIKQLEHHTKMEHSLSSLGLTSLVDVESENTVIKNEPVVSAVPVVDCKPPLSVIHPITISNGLVLTPTRHLKTVSKNEILVTHRLATAASLQKKSAMASLVTPPATPQKKINLSSIATSQPPDLDEKQQVINERVARALAAAKQAMEAAAAKETVMTPTSA